VIAGGGIVVLILYLLYERLLIAKRIQCIPLRICVTGTRGKSSVTRLIFSSLKEAGFNVLAKTTGSKPVIIFPDGSEKEIKRHGNPTLLEEKHILNTAIDLHVQAIVLELMSINPESIFIESVKMVKPNILIITNVRLDHLAQMGKSKEVIANCFASAIPEKSTVVICQEEFFPAFIKISEERDSKLVQIPRDYLDEFADFGKMFPSFEFEQNIRLSLAVTDYLGIERETALAGIKSVCEDFGGLRAWEDENILSGRKWVFVSAFAANDPESTKDVLLRIKRNGVTERKKIIGILNLRSDRGDRTLQWMEALKQGNFPDFDKLILIGKHGAVLKKKLRSLQGTELYALNKKNPEGIVASLREIEKEDAVIVGIGNMAGAGEALVKYWEKTGRNYDI